MKSRFSTVNRSKTTIFLAESKSRFFRFWGRPLWDTADGYARFAVDVVRDVDGSVAADALVGEPLDAVRDVDGSVATDALVGEPLDAVLDVDGSIVADAVVGEPPDAVQDDGSVATDADVVSTHTHTHTHSRVTSFFP